MKTMSLCCACAALLAACSLHHDHSSLQLSARDQSEIKRVAVLDFRDVSESEDDGAVFADLLSNALVGVEEYEIVERSQLGKLLEQWAIDMQAGLPAPQVTEALRIDGYVIGKVSVFERSADSSHGEVHATVRLVSAKDGTVLWSYTADVAGHHGPEGIAGAVATQVVTALREAFASRQ